MVFNNVSDEIFLYGWFFFGEKKFDCHGIERGLDFYIKNERLPPLCNECYKALISWHKSSVLEDNLDKLFGILTSLNVKNASKLNESLSVIYFREKMICLILLKNLEMN